jgi:hypothetical protein
MFVDVTGEPLLGRYLQAVFTLVASAAGEAVFYDTFVGKSGRVGGAMSAAMSGVPELQIRITGSWKSDALLRYIGGILVENSGMWQKMVEMGQIYLPTEQRSTPTQSTYR